MSAPRKRSLSAVSPSSGSQEAARDGAVKREESSGSEFEVSPPAAKPKRTQSEGAIKDAKKAKVKAKEKVTLESDAERLMRVRTALANSRPLRPAAGWRPLSALRIGYPCMNRSLGASGGHVFRQANHSAERVIQAVQMNLDEIETMIKWNIEKGLKFFRIGSEVVPFASHKELGPLFDWRAHFKKQLTRIGDLVKHNGLRISMHPDHFTLLNSPKEIVLQRSVLELTYHAQFLDSLGLDTSAKMQIHVGGVYGDKKEAMRRFVDEYKRLPDLITRRLVIENDDHRFSLKDCLELHKETGVPILFDNLHHECLNNGEPMRDAVAAAIATWKRDRDGVPLFDYSSQEPGARVGNHAKSIDLAHWHAYICELAGLGVEADIMLEIKDKETSAMRALAHLKQVTEA